jgi:hydroxymethylpyrimidine pyrophosphatase-like HAD family hydrolase
VVDAAERVAALGDRVRAAGLPVHAVHSEPMYLEILLSGVSKATALWEMLRALAVDAERVVAIGDNWNDLEMIEAAGLGVAMGQAPEGVRARADYVCGTPEQDGVREVIEPFVLRGG